MTNRVLEKMKFKQKSSFIDRICESLPEMHLWGYRYCGPNTNLEQGLASNEQGINELDCACKEHDIAYNESSDPEWRCNADKLLVLKAIRRVYAKDSQIGERLAASLVSLLISIKLALSKIRFFINNARKCIVSNKKE